MLILLVIPLCHESCVINVKPVKNLSKNTNYMIFHKTNQRFINFFSDWKILQSIIINNKLWWWILGIKNRPFFICEILLLLIFNEIAHESYNFTAFPSRPFPDSVAHIYTKKYIITLFEYLWEGERENKTAAVGTFWTVWRFFAAFRVDLQLFCD